ncbi:hypothetical protein StoSoilB20_32630 [Arthrobacter sp. StoSoilB20]|nr:hypothetical protein StoSoilB20_32630 [Arthrobacter sp. StoSoilB20]
MLSKPGFGYPIRVAPREAFNFKYYAGRTKTQPSSEIGVVDGESAKFRTRGRPDFGGQYEVGVRIASNLRDEADRQGVLSDFDTGLGESESIERKEQQIGWKICAGLRRTQINPPPSLAEHLLEGVEHRACIHVQYSNSFNGIEQ